jgi:hypothetical protein
MTLPALPLLLFGQQASEHWPLAGEPLLSWAAAFDEWLDWLGRERGRHMRQRRWHAWADFLAFCSRPSWEVSRADLEGWAALLAARGLLYATILKKLRLDAWRLVEEDRPDPVQEGGLGPPRRRNRARGAPKGNQQGLKHGLYASRLPAEDFEGLDELPRESLEEEIKVLRVIIGRTLAWADKSQTLEQSCHFLRCWGTSPAAWRG